MLAQKQCRTVHYNCQTIMNISTNQETMNSTQEIATEGELTALETQLAYITFIEQVLSCTKFKRFMAEFWLKHPTITSVTWNCWIRKCTKPTGLRSEVKKITFTSEEEEEEVFRKNVLVYISKVDKGSVIVFNKASALFQ